MDRWTACPGSVQLCAKAPRSESSVWASEGTCAHHVLELCLKNNSQAHFFEGMYMHVNGELLSELETEHLDLVGTDIFEIVQDMHEAVQVATDYVEQEKLRLRRVYNVEPIVWLERAFHMKKFHEGAFGTSDVILLIPGKEIVVIDYKHGAGKFVSVFQNNQLKYYALGVLYTLWEAAYEFPSIIKTVIAQPRCEAEELVRSAIYSFDDIWVDFKKYMVDSILLTETFEPKLSKGSYCRWCDAQMICPEWPNAIRDTTGIDLFNEESYVMDPQVLLDDDKAVLFALRNEDNVKGFFGALKRYAFNRALSGNPIAGTGLTVGSKNRVLTQTESVEKRLLELGYSEDDIFTKKKLKGPAQLEKLPAKGDFKPKVFIGALSFKPSGEKRLSIDEESPRPRISIEHFSDLPDFDDVPVLNDPFFSFEETQVDDPFDFL